MDAGYLAPRATIDNGFSPSKLLGPEEVLGIIQAIFAHEAEWRLNSATLSQTVFTSVHIMYLLKKYTSHTHTDRKDLPKFPVHKASRNKKPPGWVGKVLRAYCLSTLLVVSLTIEGYKGSINEDFSIETHDLDLFTQVDVETFRLINQDALSWLRDSRYGKSPRRSALIN